MNDKKIGIIGIGNMGFAHAQSILKKQIKGFSLAAICDVSDKVRACAEKNFSNVPYYDDYKKLLSCEEIDAVLIATPHPLHADIAIDALNSGKHVLVEKPIDIKVSKARLLNEIAQKSGKKFAIMFNQRTGTLFKKAKEIIDNGKLGELKRSIWIVTNWYRTEHYYKSSAWRATWVGEGGGVLVNQAPHQLDLWQWICGMPIEVTAFCQTARYHKIEVEDNATLYVKFKNNAEGIFITTTGEYPGTNRLEISGTKGKLVLENGVLKFWKLSFDEREYCLNAEKSTCEKEYDYFEFFDCEVNGHNLILQNFADSIIKDEPLISPGYDGINELEIQCAAYLSEWKGNVAVKIPLDAKLYDDFLEKQQKGNSVSFEAQHLECNGYKKRWNINW